MYTTGHYEIRYFILKEEQVFQSGIHFKHQAEVILIVVIIKKQKKQKPFQFHFYFYI